jgi:hypothetical protein
MSLWTRLEAAVNEVVRDTFPSTVVYTDTSAASVTFTAVLDEAFQMVETGADGISFTSTRPVLTARLADFTGVDLEAESVCVITARTFRVMDVERLGHQDVRLYLQEVR